MKSGIFVCQPSIRHLFLLVSALTAACCITAGCGGKPALPAPQPGAAANHATCARCAADPQPGPAPASAPGDSAALVRVDPIAPDRKADSEPVASSGSAITAGLIESFDSAADFKPCKWEGATIAIRKAKGRKGGALEIGYDLAATDHWVQAVRNVSWRLPPQSRITFDLFWTGRRNIVELKFKDGDGSVYGTRIKDLPPAGRWTTLTLEPPQFTHLWGGDDKLDEVINFALAISAPNGGEGGKGVVRVDNLRVEALP